MKRKIKICGITSLEDADDSLQFGADALGFNLYSKSKRYIDLNASSNLIGQISIPFEKVFVFVNEDEGYVAECLKEVPDAIPQFHGEEDPVYCESFGRNYIKAIRVKKGVDLEDSFRKFYSASMMLLDSYVKESYGGTGSSFDWDLIDGHLEKPFFLAGGLNFSNLGEALKKINPAGIDLNSGVELSPGIKDKTKLKDCIKFIRESDDR